MAGLDPAIPLREAVPSSAGSIGERSDAVLTNGYGVKPGDDAEYVEARLPIAGTTPNAASILQT